MGTQGHEAETELRGEDIGHGVHISVYERSDYKGAEDLILEPGEHVPVPTTTAGVIVSHRHSDGAICRGTCTFDVPVNADTDRPKWKVESWNPFAAIKPRGNRWVDEYSAERLRALVVVLWRTGMRISEALDLEPRDLHRRDLTIVIRHGKGDKRRVVMMDEWGWQQLEPWLKLREEFPAGKVFCVIVEPTAGRGMYDSQVRKQLRDLAQDAGLQRRANPHSFRHSMACEMNRERIDLEAIRRQLGHARLDVTQSYLRGIDDEVMLAEIAKRPAPMMPFRI